jgi:hypothetical protein
MQKIKGYCLNVYRPGFSYINRILKFQSAKEMRINAIKLESRGFCADRLYNGRVYFVRQAESDRIARRRRDRIL